MGWGWQSLPTRAQQWYRRVDGLWSPSSKGLTKTRIWTITMSDECSSDLRCTNNITNTSPPHHEHIRWTRRGHITNTSNEHVAITSWTCQEHIRDTYRRHHAHMTQSRTYHWHIQNTTDTSQTHHYKANNGIHYGTITNTSKAHHEYFTDTSVTYHEHITNT